MQIEIIPVCAAGKYFLIVFLEDKFKIFMKALNFWFLALI